MLGKQVVHAAFMHRPRRVHNEEEKKFTPCAVQPLREARLNKCRTCHANLDAEDLIRGGLLHWGHVLRACCMIGEHITTRPMQWGRCMQCIGGGAVHGPRWTGACQLHPGCRQRLSKPAVLS